ncbi:hypothetical protein [Candidatus Phytoplasma fraxini]
MDDRENDDATIIQQIPIPSQIILYYNMMQLEQQQVKVEISIAKVKK